ncbi:MAG: hypothetical protein LIO53_05905 [Oscillospiraceae bacterium]|nr:hypothetical protein [Oscillospiraceae bacterium]
MMMDFMKKFMSKEITPSVKVIVVTLIAAFVLSLSAYGAGSAQSLNNSVESELQTAVEDIEQLNSDAEQEIELLSNNKSELDGELAEKESVQTAMREYDEKKSEYTSTISQLNTDIAALDTDTQQKQTELSEKKAAKEEALRVAAEEAAAKKAAAQSSSQSTMVWIGETGTKYHKENCRTLRGNKYQITLDEALAQGREACKVCH